MPVGIAIGLGGVAQDEVAGGTGGARIPIDGRMIVVEAPKDVGRQYYGDCARPMPVHQIYEVIHQRRNSIMRWRNVVPDIRLARGIAGDGRNWP